MKRLVAVIGMVAMLSVAFGGWQEFDTAKTAVDLFKSLFLIVVGTIAFLACLDDFKKNVWPL